MFWHMIVDMRSTSERSLLGRKSRDADATQRGLPESHMQGRDIPRSHEGGKDDKREQLEGKENNSYLKLPT
jgi:hypothetical protein